MQKIYLDNAATTQLDKEVLKAMEPFFCDVFGNASSLHSFGQEASKAIEDSREKISNFLNCKPEEVIFTSGATESNNIAIQGIVKEGDHIITTSIEHPSVLETCQYLEKKGMEVTYVKPQADGIIQVKDVQNEIKDNTVLVSIMYANNEIGTIQPIKEIGEIIKDKNIIFHTDAVQTTNYLDMDVEKLNVDLLSLSGHKIYGPKGVGVLFVKEGTKIQKIQHGGHHEFKIRPGTLNVPGIVGLGKAIELIKARDNEKIRKLRDYTWELIQKKINNVKLNGSLEQRLDNNLNVSIVGVEGEALLLGFDMAGIAVSTGSACSSGSLEPSHVLMSLGLSHEESHGSLRISLGKENTQDEIEYFVGKLLELVEKYRKMAP
ncbi:MAG: cysteine desulfurase family protein [Patescibacteria group bacterium]